MIIKSKVGSNQIISLAAFIFAAILAYQMVIHFDSNLLLLLGGVLAVFTIIWHPILGLVAYLLVYPMVPAEESLNMLKGAMFGLTILLLAIWLIQKLISNKAFHLKPEYRWLFVFFVFLCFSPLLGIYNNFTIVDWGRDIAPLLSLLLIPVIVEYAQRQGGYRLLYFLFLGPLFISLVQIILWYLGEYGFYTFEFEIPLQLARIHPSLSLGLGLIMYFHKAPYRWLWIVVTIISLAIVFLTPSRTIWITTATMVMLIVGFSSNRRLWTTLSLGMLVLLMGFLFLKGGPITYIDSQRERLHQLVEYHSDLSFENRVEEIKKSGELFLSSPLWGVGFGYQYNFWRPFITGIGAGFMDTNYTHNDIMYIASKGGLIALIFFGLMLYGIGKKLFQRRKENPGSIQSAWATIAIIALLNSLIIGLSTPVLQTRSAAFALAILLALGLGYNPKGINGSNSVSAKISNPRF